MLTEILLSKHILPQVYQEIISLWSQDLFEIVQQQIQQVFPQDWEVQLQNDAQGLSVLISTQCTAVQVAQSVQLVRDFSWIATHNKVSAAILCKNAQIFAPSKKNQQAYFAIRIAIQGGHRLSPVEYQFVKEIGISLGQNDVQVITGSGGGAMKAAMEGAILGYWENKHFDKKQHLIGLTQTTILQAEFPNQYVNQVIVFPTMEQRLEAFFRLSDAIFVTVGGVGTIQEILMLLLLQLKNTELMIPYFFVCSSEQREIFLRIFSFLSEFSPQEQQWIDKIFCIQNAEERNFFTNSVMQTVEETRTNNRKHSNRVGVSWKPHWNKFLKFSHTSNKELSNTIVLKPEKNLHKSLSCVYQFFAQMVQISISSRNDEKKIFLQGDKNIIKKGVALLQFLQQKQKLSFDVTQVFEW